MLDLNFASAQQTTIEMVDVNGNVVLSQNVGILIGEVKQTLDITELSSGMYLVRVVSALGTEVQKVVIE